MAFQERLFYYRKKERLSQGELANKMEVSQRTISAWETGRNEPSMGDLTKLSRIFGCTLADLTGTRERKVGEISFEDVKEKVRHLGIDELYELKDIIGSEIKILIERRELEKEKKDLEKRLLEMQKKMEALNQRLKEGD